MEQKHKLMKNDTVVTYTNSSIGTSFLWITTNTVSTDVWTDRTPTKSDKLVFWTPDMVGDGTLSPDDEIWDEIDAMLEKVWTSNHITIEEEIRIDSEMIDAIRESEIRQFEELYGETRDWE